MTDSCPNYADMLLERSRYEFECPFCGRAWRSAGGRQTGFLKASAKTHVQSCGERSPEQRLRENHKIYHAAQQARSDHRYQEVLIPSDQIPGDGIED